MVMTRAAEGIDDIGAVISGSIISNLRFADGIATLAESRMSLQDMVRNINREGSRLGLHINAAKTETQCFSKQNQVIRLSIGNVALKQVESFVYLGGEVTSSNSSSEDIARRIGLATRVARSLQPIWKSANIAACTKLFLYISRCQISYYTDNYMAHDRIADRARGGLTTYRRTAERWECRSQPQTDLHKSNWMEMCCRTAAGAHQIVGVVIA